MRLSVLPLALSLCLGATAQQKPLQVYLHPIPSASGPDSPPTLSAAQAKAVLAHHLGKNIGDFEEIPSDEGLWSHLIGMWGDEKVVGEKDKARVVILEGGVLPQDVLPTSISSEPSFYLQEEQSTRALLAPYLQRASHFLENVLHSIPGLPDRLKDLFAFADSRAAAVLDKELSGLSAMAESIPWLDHSRHSYPWEAISISSLSHLGRGDEVWEAGCRGVQASLEAMTTPVSPPLLLVIVPDQSVLDKRQIPLLDEILPFFGLQDGEDEPNNQTESKNATAKVCYASQDDCSSSTTCFGRGSCTLKSKSGDEECWGCKCNSGYAGVSCQKEDYSTPFVILILSSFFLVAALVGSIALLYSVGETKLPSTLNLAIGNPKRD